MMEEEDQGQAQDSEEEEEEEEEDEDEEEEDDDDDDEGDEEGQRRPPKSDRGQPSTPTRRNRRRTPKTAEETTHLNAPSFVTSSSGDAYLLASSMTSRTSDNLLSAHVDEPFTHDSYLSVLHASDTAPAMDAYHASLQATLDKLSLRCFATWVWYMKQGFNYLVHGVGSKIPLLNRFAEEVSTRFGPVVVVNGYDPSTTLQDVLTALEEIVKEAIRQDLLEAIPTTRSGHKPSAKSLAAPTKRKGKAKATTNDSSDATLVISGSTSAIEARAQRFAHSLASAPSALLDIYLVVHSLDAPSLRASKSLSILALLASQPRLHFVASVDHVRSGLLFPTALAATRPPPNLKRHQANLNVRSFTFLYQEASTRQPYTTEVLHNGTLSRLFPSTIFPLSSTLDPSTSSLVQSTRHVLASVTDRAKSIFNLLACQQLELMRARKGEDKVGVAGGGGGGGGGRAPGCAILLDKFKELATDRLLAAHNDQVDGLLAEFRDHNVVRGSMNRPKQVVEEGEDDQEEEEEEDGNEGEWVWIALGREALENVWEELGMER
ncbi:BQ5605_C002g01385 [Microbotryum silenes-dioicae]|uniref:Origin recognition complex subunit 2 n=1 Tax=Microbotryum silenes-dioicae TaxID=796604 RepID=A0A2X0MKJ1_9BASI|nr:BQ5605_C002g01385 [Microbotryum silenes-dioicae]